MDFFIFSLVNEFDNYLNAVNSNDERKTAKRYRTLLALLLTLI